MPPKKKARTKIPPAVLVEEAAPIAEGLQAIAQALATLSDHLSHDGHRPWLDQKLAELDKRLSTLNLKLEEIDHSPWRNPRMPTRTRM